MRWSWQGAVGLSELVIKVVEGIANRSAMWRPVVVKLLVPLILPELGQLAALVLAKCPHSLIAVELHGQLQWALFQSCH